MRRLLLRLGTLGARRPRAVVLAVALLALAAGLAMRRFAIEPDISRMLPDSRAVTLFRDLERRTAGGRSLLIAVHGAGAAALDRELPRLAEELRASPFLERVDLTRAELLGLDGPAALLWSLDAPARAALQARLTTERRRQLEQSLQVLAEDPLGGRDLVLRDPLDLRLLLAEAAARALPLDLAPDSEHVVLAGGKVGLLRAVGRREPYDADFASAMLADVEGRLAGVQCDLWGGHLVAREQASRMQADMVWSTACASVLVGLYLAWAMRGVLTPLLVLLPTGLAILWALPLGSAVAGPFNVIAVGAAAVLIGLGDDFSIHYLARYGAERAGAGPVPAAARTFRGVGVPIALGGLTTCSAFLSLALGDFHGLAGFGFLLATGLVFAMLLTFVLLPALLSGRGRVLALRTAPRSVVTAALERLAASRAGLPIAAVLLALGAAGLALVLTRGLRFDVDADALSPRASSAQAARTRIEHLVGFASIPAVVLLDEAVPPERLHAGLATLRETGVLAFADGPQRFLPDAATRAAVASFRQATAGFVAAALADLEDLGLDAPAFAPGLQRLAAMLAEDPPPVPERYEVVDGGQRRLALFCYLRQAVRSEAAFQAFAAAVQRAFGEGAAAFGAFALLGEVRAVLLHDLTACTLATAVVVALCAVALARGHWLGWLALLPVLAGTGITAGLLIVFDVALNLANFVAIPFVIGIGVDDGLHLASHYRHTDRRAGLGSTGVAIWRTTLTTALAFGALGASSNPGLQSLGGIAVGGVLLCLLASFLVMVPIVRWTARGAVTPAAGPPRA